VDDVDGPLVVIVVADVVEVESDEVLASSVSAPPSSPPQAATHSVPTTTQVLSSRLTGAVSRKQRLACQPTLENREFRPQDAPGFP
jgi:hypothetical protein